MIVKNKKNTANVLAYKAGVQNVRVNIRGGEELHIHDLEDFNQIINKNDFDNSRGWFEVVNEVKKTDTEIKAEVKIETNLDKAKKEVKEYTSKESKKK